jgi:ribonucleoside-diphosphate reductase beta chain
MNSSDRDVVRRPGFTSLQAGGLDWEALPLRLFRKGNAKFWNPEQIDFTEDAQDWQRLPDTAKEAFTGLCAMFLAGEEAVTHDLQPFISAMAQEGRFGDEMYLTQFCFEEARHVQVFRRWLDEVGLTADLSSYVADNPGYQAIFCEALPESLDALRADPSPANQVRASATYNQVIEGTLALTGYFAWNRVCTKFDIFPGMREIVTRIGDDERRHMAWGTHTCRRHVAADSANWDIARRRVRELMPHAARQIRHATEPYPEEVFGLATSELISYALDRSRRRLGAIHSAVESRASRPIETDIVAEELEEVFAREDAVVLAATSEAGRRVKARA